MKNIIPNFLVYNPSEGRICFWCLKKFDFSSKYHIIPAYLTLHENYEFVLPSGIVCSSCNNKFSTAENNFVEFFQERLVFFNVPKRDGTKRSSVISSLHRYVTISPGKVSYDLNYAGFNSKSANIAFTLQKRGFDSAYYREKSKSNNNYYKKGLIHSVIAKIGLECLYSFYAEVKNSDEHIYKNFIMDHTNNFHKHRSSIYEFITKSNKTLVNNVLTIGNYGKNYSDWNLNVNYLHVSHIDDYPIIWVRILGLLFLVNFLPNGNQDLTKEKVWELVKAHNNKFISDLINENIEGKNVERLKQYYFD